MVNVASFQAEMETVIKRVDDHLEDSMKAGLSEGYLQIFREWPAYTYYSMANNRVSRASPIETPIPAERPTNPNEMADDAAIQLQVGLQEIQTFKLNTSRDTIIFISNPVDYASDVGFAAGAGDAIYQNAAATAEEVIEQTWFNRITFGV